MMEAAGRYGRSPLTEALIDLRCRVPSGVTLETLAGLQAGEQERYPDRQRQMRVQGAFTAGSEVSAAATQRQLGYMFWNLTRSQAFQARLDGFTFNRLAPYDCWTSFRDEARRLWEQYRAVVRPEGITRVAVRYINRLDLPLPFADLREYLRTVPELSPELPQGLSGYFLHLEIPYEEIGAMLLLNQALAEPKREGAVSVILDIDLFRQYDPPIQDEVVWQYLELLRVKKNQVFEACITDRSREVFR